MKQCELREVTEQEKKTMVEATPCKHVLAKMLVGVNPTIADAKVQWDDTLIFACPECATAIAAFCQSVEAQRGTLLTEILPTDRRHTVWLTESIN
jgi:hypothetical protein